MKNTALILIAAFPLAAAEPTAKPAPVSPTRAIVRLGRDEAKKTDANKDGLITGPEVGVLKAEYAKDVNGPLAIFDDNGNGQLDDAEITSMKFSTGAKPPTAPAPGKPAPAKPEPAKPAPPKPAPAKPAPSKPAPKSTKSIGELALDEAKKADANGDGKITGTEVTVLKMEYAKNPTSWLSVYDDNANKQLDDEEIKDLKWGPAAAPTPVPEKKKRKK